MIPLFNGVMLAVSSSLVLSIVAKVTVTTALALSGVRLARRSRAAVRHALLAAGFGVMLALPVVSIVAPPVRIVSPMTAQDRAWLPPLAGTIDAAPDITATDGGAGGVPVVPPRQDSRCRRCCSRDGSPGRYCFCCR